MGLKLSAKASSKEADLPPMFLSAFRASTPLQFVASPRCSSGLLWKDPCKAEVVRALRLAAELTLRTMTVFRAVRLAWSQKLEKK